MLYANDEYGRGVAASVAAAFRAAGGALVAQDPYLPEMFTAGTGPEPYLRRALDRGMDALFIAGSADDASAILPRARGLGSTGLVMGADGLPGVEEEGAVAEGVFIGAAFFADTREQAAARFVAEYQRRFRQPPNADAALGYDAMRVIEQALAQAGTDRERIRAYMAGVGTANPPWRASPPRSASTGTATWRRRRWPSAWRAAAPSSARGADPQPRAGRTQLTARPASFTASLIVG